MPQVKAPKIQPREEKDIISEHYSKIGKKRWTKMSAIERMEYASRIAKKRWSKQSKEDRIAYLRKIGFNKKNK